MRTLFISLITLYISQNSFARPLFEDQQTKYYSHKHDILFDYATKEACEGDGMKWNGEDCLTEATDSVEITREGQLYLVKIGTTANHTNTCEFESSNGYFNRKNKLISSQITNDDDYEESNKAKKSTDLICQVSITFNKDQSISVHSKNNDENCICGLNASLNIRKAIKN